MPHILRATEVSAGTPFYVTSFPQAARGHAAGLAGLVLTKHPPQRQALCSGACQASPATSISMTSQRLCQPLFMQATTVGSQDYQSSQVPSIPPLHRAALSPALDRRCLCNPADISSLHCQSLHHHEVQPAAWAGPWHAILNTRPEVLHQLLHLSLLAAHRASLSNQPLTQALHTPLLEVSYTRVQSAAAAAAAAALLLLLLPSRHHRALQRLLQLA